MGDEAMKTKHVAPLLIMGALLSAAGPASAAVERVIVISIDGIRSTEGFGDPDCQPGGTGECWLSNLKTLLPLGTLYAPETSSPATGSAFLNNAATWTVPGHTMLLTGVRDIEPNTKGVLELRPFRPTLFERIRARVPTLTQDDVVGVVRKTHMTRLDYSTDPAHGSTLEGKLYNVPDHQAQARGRAGGHEGPMPDAGPATQRFDPAALPGHHGPQAHAPLPSLRRG
jgi:hypothetical protein